MTGQTTSVLLVEDNPGDARLVTEMLKEGGESYALTHVDTVGAAVAHLAAQPDVDVVLLDLSLPDESGLATVRRVLSAKPRAGVVVMTGIGDDELGVAATLEGARDYLVKGQVDFRTLRRAIKLAMVRQMKEAQLENESLTDELTGLNNRRGFLLHGDQQIKLASRHHESIVLVYIDLDGFKQINDWYGHAEGDRALQETAAVLKRSLRETDIKARIGGDEFVGLAINASEGGAAALRGRLDAALHDINVTRALPYKLTFSVGLFRCPPDPTATMDDLLKHADALMYEEKRKKKESR